MLDRCENKHDQLNDDNGDDTNIPDWAYNNNSSTVPTTNHDTILPVLTSTAETAPAHAIETSALNCCLKSVIKPRVQADKATMNVNDCANSDCDDPKRPGKLINCTSLGCRTKVPHALYCLLFDSIMVSQFHSTCLPVGMKAGNWFCDNVCHANSSLHSKRHRIQAIYCIFNGY